MALISSGGISAANGTANATGSDLTAPTIKSVDPIKNAVNVPANKVIKLTFSESIKTGTGWIELLDSSGKTVPVTTSISNNVLTIKPNSNLVKGTKYTVVIHTGSVKDLAGNNVKSYISYFTVDIIAPRITSIDPAKNAVNVPANKVIKVKFSESIKTGTNWIELIDNKGKTTPVTTSINGNILTITPNSNLAKGTKYTLALHTGGVKDLAGNNVAGYVSYFTVDSTPPTVKSVDPTKNAVNIAANKVIKLTFSESIKTGTNWIELIDNKGKTTPVTTSINGNILTITPSSYLTKGIKYTLALHTGSVTDLAGNNVASYISYFTVDSTSPTVKSINPSNNAVNVETNNKIKVTFSESIKTGTGWIELQDSSGTIISTTLSISGNALTIIPSSSLTKGTKYTLLMHTGSVTDLAGNNVAAYVSSFTSYTTFTVAQIQDAAASVESFVDANNKLPSYVTIGTSQITMPQFLQLLVTSLSQINSGTTTSVPLGNINAPTSPTGNYIYGNISSTEYLSIAQSIESYIESNNKAPNYTTSSLGNIQYESLVYTYSKILNFYKTNDRLPGYVTVNSSVIIASELQQYLQATANCQVTNSQIKAKAAALTSGKTTAYDKAVAIYNWVRDNLAYSFYYDTKYGAVGTLNAMKGNCVDHSHLLIALLRAAGIPARYVHGTCTFTSGSTYGHVWAQVWIDGKWYNADATSTKNSLGVIKNWDTSTYTYKGTYASLLF